MKHLTLIIVIAIAASMCLCVFAAPTKSSVAARHLVNSGAGVSAKDYVQNGLVAMWDGIENAGWGTHDATATRWKDLIGSADLTLLGNCSFHDSYCTIMGVNNSAYAQYEGEVAPSSGNGWTVRFVFSRLDNASYVARPYSLRNNLNGFERYQQNGTSNGLFSGDGSGYIERHGLFSSSLNTAIAEHYVIAADGALTIYVNGSVVATSTVKVPTSIPRAGMGNSMGINQGRGANEDVYALAIYNRALTAAEVAANYAIDKERFGLP